MSNVGLCSWTSLFFLEALEPSSWSLVSKLWSLCHPLFSEGIFIEKCNCSIGQSIE